MAGIDVLCSLMGQWRKALPGCRRLGMPAFSARSLALDGVSWAHRGSVESAVGHGMTACYKIRAVFCSLPRASLLLGAGYGLLSGGPKRARTRFHHVASRA